MNLAAHRPYSPTLRDHGIDYDKGSASRSARNLLYELNCVVQSYAAVLLPACAPSKWRVELGLAPYVPAVDPAQYAGAHHALIYTVVTLMRTIEVILRVEDRHNPPLLLEYPPLRAREARRADDALSSRPSKSHSGERGWVEFYRYIGVGMSLEIQALRGAMNHFAIIPTMSPGVPFDRILTYVKNVSMDIEDIVNRLNEIIETPVPILPTVSPSSQAEAQPVVPPEPDSEPDRPVNRREDTPIIGRRPPLAPSKLSQDTSHIEVEAITEEVLEATGRSPSPRQPTGLGVEIQQQDRLSPSMPTIPFSSDSSGGASDDGASWDAEEPLDPNTPATSMPTPGACRKPDCDCHPILLEVTVTHSAGDPRPKEKLVSTTVVKTPTGYAQALPAPSPMYPVVPPPLPVSYSSGLPTSGSRSSPLPSPSQSPFRPAGPTPNVASQERPMTPEEADGAIAGAQAALSHILGPSAATTEPSQTSKPYIGSPRPSPNLNTRLDEPYPHLAPRRPSTVDEVSEEDDHSFAGSSSESFGCRDYGTVITDGRLSNYSAGSARSYDLEQAAADVYDALQNVIQERRNGPHRELEPIKVTIEPMGPPPDLIRKIERMKKKAVPVDVSSPHDVAPPRSTPHSMAARMTPPQAVRPLSSAAGLSPVSSTASTFLQVPPRSLRGQSHSRSTSADSFLPPSSTFQSIRETKPGSDAKPGLQGSRRDGSKEVPAGTTTLVDTMPKNFTRSRRKPAPPLDTIFKTPAATPNRFEKELPPTHKDVQVQMPSPTKSLASLPRRRDSVRSVASSSSAPGAVPPKDLQGERPRSQHRYREHRSGDVQCCCHVVQIPVQICCHACCRHTTHSHHAPVPSSKSSTTLPTPPSTPPKSKPTSLAPDPLPTQRKDLTSNNKAYMRSAGRAFKNEAWLRVSVLDEFGTYEVDMKNPSRA